VQSTEIVPESQGWNIEVLAMVTKRSSIKLTFQIKSLDKTRSTSSTVSEVKEISKSLEYALGKKFPAAKVRISRGEGIPGVPELQYILLHIDWELMRKSAEGALVTFATTQFLTLITTRVKNLLVKRVDQKKKHPERGKQNRSGRKK
jgi:hypothetical protein